MTSSIDHLYTETVSSNPAQGMDVCPVSLLCCLCCPAQGVQQNVGIRIIISALILNLKRSPRLIIIVGDGSGGIILKQR
jgi:hypothetical protein